MAINRISCVRGGERWSGATPKGKRFVPRRVTLVLAAGYAALAPDSTFAEYDR